MKCVIEANIPFICGVLEPFATVEYLNPEEITADAVSDADALIVRTRTRCDEKLLAGSKCRFIGTATIGTDHIDKEYCRRQGITVASAPGCNAPGVAQYVLSVIGHWMQKEEIIAPQSLTLGVVGVGHVGSIIARWAENIGFRVLRNDPPRQRAEGDSGFATIEQVMREADIITFHTPLIKCGVDATYHLCDTQFINHLGRCSLLINSARGSIVDTQALLDSNIKDIAIDCWEEEPQISLDLLQKASVATPHIAGYSREGKCRATAMILAQLASHFALPLQMTAVDMGASSNPTLAQIMASYDSSHDTAALKLAPSTFESLRNHYNLRPEV